MDHKYVIGEYVVLTNPRDEQDARGNWRVQSQMEEDGVTRYVVSEEINTNRFGRTRMVAEGDLRSLHNEHAHVGTESRDCDGRYTGIYVEMPNDDERCDLLGDLYFKQRVLDDIVSLHGDGTLKVSPTGLDWYEQTDEGYRSAEVLWCADDTCSDIRPRHRYRDHTAEAAGY